MEQCNKWIWEGMNLWIFIEIWQKVNLAGQRHPYPAFQPAGSQTLEQRAFRHIFYP